MLTSNKISSLVIDTLRKQTGEQNIAVIFLYCDYQAQKDQSVVNMIGSLVRQATLREPTIPNETKRAFDKSRREGGDSLQLPDIVKLFGKVSGYMEVVYLCVDAVDEVLPQHRLGFLRALRQILQDAPHARLFLTGRPYIRAELDTHLTEKAYAIHIIADQGDITRYLRQKMNDDQDPGLMTEDLKNNIMTTMVEKTSEMWAEKLYSKFESLIDIVPRFLLVALNIEAILGETSLASRKKMLRKVATTGVGLDTVYAQTLQRIMEQKGDRSRLGMEVLMWVSHAERPLLIDELCHALAVDLESTGLDPENIRPQDTVLGSCLGLAVVDAETSTVRLIHYTLQEYLSRHGIFPDAHKTLGLTCLVYLNYEQIKGLPANGVSTLEDMPFLAHSSLHWGRHAKLELSDSAKSLALELLNRAGNHISVTLLFEQIGNFHSCSRPHHLWPSLHCASYFGIVEVMASLIQKEGCGINLSDCMDCTPLMWAAGQGNEGVVKTLLARNDINPDKPDKDGETPLLRASFQGHEGVVKLLLARNDVNPDKQNSKGQTPLWRASCYGHEGVVKLLLAQNNVNPDQPSKDGRTPLRTASWNGYEGVVKLLLARNDVNPDKPDNEGSTPLLSASGTGHEGVVKLLLARNNVNPNKLTNSGLTPLLAASWNGHEGVVKLLLARNDLNPDKPNNEGQTPRLFASQNGHEGVVKVLLARKDVDPDKASNEGGTPLWATSFNGHEGVVKLLLARNDVGPDKPSNDGRTPLRAASYNGHEGVVKLLLARNDVDPDKASNEGVTPLWAASFNGHEGVVKLLLARNDVDPDKASNDSRTPLRAASCNGHEGVVKLLLARNVVNPEKPNHKGQTPLQCSSDSGHEAVVKLLK